MRRLWYTAAGLALAPLMGLSLLPGAEPPKETKPAPPLSSPVLDPTDKACGSYGTKIDFLDSPMEAAKLAKKENKLVFILHVSGHFEDPKFTWNNAEALRVNALNNPEVGKYINENCVASFQKVATFKIVGNQKQGGNVAAYFCAPDGRVLHVVAGPVDAATMLRESKWVVETAEKAIKESKGDGAAFKAALRKAHAERLRTEYGLVVEPVTYDPVVEQDPKSALTYNDPSGRPLAPKLPPPPIDGPDVALRDKQEAAARMPGARELKDAKGRGWQLNNQGRVHQIMAAHCMVKIENVYGTIFENILGEKISTKPVEIVTPFPWVKEGKRGG